MCATCGCGNNWVRIGGKLLQNPSKQVGSVHYKRFGDKAAKAFSHHNLDKHVPADSGSGAASGHAAGMHPARTIKIERDLLAKNNHYAASNRSYLAERGIFTLNLVSSPGSGKTTLLVQTIAALQNKQRIYVIEGDQQTENDAARIRACGIPALQINTGKGCHLDAYMVSRAIQQLAVQDDSVLFIENVGNLVCPASFDLGEAHKVVILSVTEGEDKPLKYPDMFRAADVLLLNKCDLLPYLTFDTERAIDYARRINPALKVIKISAMSGEGMPEWLDWVECGYQQTLAVRVQADHSYSYAEQPKSSRD